MLKDAKNADYIHWADFLQKNIVYCFEVLRRFIRDNESQFKDRRYHTFYEKFKIKDQWSCRSFQQENMQNSQEGSIKFSEARWSLTIIPKDQFSVGVWRNRDGMIGWIDKVSRGDQFSEALFIPHQKSL